MFHVKISHEGEITEAARNSVLGQVLFEDDVTKALAALAQMQKTFDDAFGPGEVVVGFTIACPVCGADRRIDAVGMVERCARCDDAAGPARSMPRQGRLF